MIRKIDVSSLISKQKTTSIMEHRAEFNRILLMLMMTVKATWATVEWNWYHRLEQEQNITGSVGAELNAQTDVHCAIM